MSSFTRGPIEHYPVALQAVFVALELDASEMCPRCVMALTDALASAYHKAGLHLSVARFDGIEPMDHLACAADHFRTVEEVSKLRRLQRDE